MNCRESMSMAAVAVALAGTVFAGREDIAPSYSWGQHCLTVKNLSTNEAFRGVTAKWKYTIDARVFASGEESLDGLEPGKSVSFKFKPPSYNHYTPMGWGEKFVTVAFCENGRELFRRQYQPWWRTEAWPPYIQHCHTYDEWKQTAAGKDVRWTHRTTEMLADGRTGLPKSLKHKGREIITAPMVGSDWATAKAERFGDGSFKVAVQVGKMVPRSPYVLEFGVPKTLETVRFFGPGPEDTREATVELWTASAASPARHAGVRWLELTGGGAKLRIRAVEPVHSANFGFRFAETATGRTVILDADAPCAFVFDPYDPADGLLLTKPCLQAMTTTGCTVMVETTREEPSLKLVWKGGAEPFSFARCEASGTYRATARIDGLKPGTHVDFEVAGEKGSFTTWKDGCGFKCAVFGDYQCGVLDTDWELDPMLCGERMFVDMAKGERCEFAVGTGDVADTGDYEKEIRPLVLERQFSILGPLMPSFMAFGNHDTKYRLNHFFYANPRTSGDPEVESFAFWRDDCLFVCLDDAEAGVDQSPLKPATMRWLERLLRSEAAQKAKFRFVFQHVPLFEEEFGNCDRAPIDLYSECNVDCVFSGDHHGYARLERAGIRQVVNGCFGYFDHGRPECVVHCNWYGDETLVGGHSAALTNRTWRFQKPGCPGVLGPETPINHGLLAGYGTLEVRGDTATYRQLGFNADGSKNGVLDSFTMKAGVRPPKKRGLAMERYAYDKTDWHCAYILTGKGGAVLELEEKGPKVLRFRVPGADGGLVPADADFDLARGVNDRIWRSQYVIDEAAGVVGVDFTDRKTKETLGYRLLPDNTVQIRRKSSE